jgi:predicted molibdopterin-dependent oxidoreductase YjgC
MRASIILLLMLTGLVGQAAAQNYPQASRSGVIEALDFASSSMIVSGYQYDVGVDTRVEIGGSYGAFTMLQPGMRIRFDYLVVSRSERRMVLIQELPAHVAIDET